MLRPVLAALIAAGACAGQTGGDPDLGDGPLQERLTTKFRAIEAELIEFRRDLHRHPEVSGQEQRTAGAVAARPRARGIEVRTGVGGHGVVAIVRGARPGPVVAFRADLDAVFSNTTDPVPFASVNPGIRHICGHDVHATVGVALAEGFAAVRADLPGTVVIVFQPAEERATGARAMLADGVFGNPRPDAIYAVHSAPLEVGQLATAPGQMMAARDQVVVSVTGSGDRSAAVAAARAVVEGVGTVPPGSELAPQTGDFIYVQIGQLSASGFTAILSLASPAARARAREIILREVAAVAVPSVAASASYQDRWIAGVSNDTALTSAGSAAIEAVLGQGAVLRLTTTIPAFSEDFGSFQEQVPGVMFFLGVSNQARGTAGYPHRPDYVADEGAILVAARAMAAAILGRLGA